MNKEMKTLLIIAGTVFLCSCAPQTVVPSMPKFDTQQGKACGRQCQVIYNQCIAACSEMIGGAATRQQRRVCLDNCNITIGDCYSTCE